MIDLHPLLELFSTYCHHVGIPETTLSSRIYGESKKIALLRERGERGLTVERYNQTLRYLADNWPADLRWPEILERPTVAA